MRTRFGRDPARIFPVSNSACGIGKGRRLRKYGLFHETITRYGSTLYIGIAMVVPIPQYIRKCQFLLSVSSEFDV